MTLAGLVNSFSLQVVKSTGVKKQEKTENVLEQLEMCYGKGWN